MPIRKVETNDSQSLVSRDVRTKARERREREREEWKRKDAHAKHAPKVLAFFKALEHVVGRMTNESDESGRTCVSSYCVCMVSVSAEELP